MVPRSSPRRQASQPPDPQELTFTHSTGQASAIDVVRISDLRSRRMDHSMYDPTRLDFHQIQFVDSGTGRHWCDFEPVEVKAGSTLLVRSGQVHAFDANSEHDGLMLFFTPQAMADLRLASFEHWHPDAVMTPREEDFTFLLDLVRLQSRLDTETRDVRPLRAGPHLLAAILEGLAGIVAAQRGPVSVADRRAATLVHAFEALLDEHHASCRNASWYAASLHVTPRTLSRACHRVRGLGPKRMIDARVGLEAKRMLSTSDDAVEAIAIELGFSEATNFVKFFRRVVGSTPEAFRQAFESAPKTT